MRGSGSRAEGKGLSGKWKIVDMPDLTEDYMRLSRDPHIKLAFRGKHVEGHYEYGLCNGELDGEVIKTEEGGLEIRFSFEGVDELDQVNGYGYAALSDDNKTLTGKLHYHMGDDWRIICRRNVRKSTSPES